MHEKENSCKQIYDQLKFLPFGGNNTNFAAFVTDETTLSLFPSHQTLNFEF